MRHGQGGAHDGRAVRVPGHPVDEGPVDLELADRQALQIAQAGVASPKIVQAQLHPQLGEGAHALGHVGAGLHQQAFGDFQLHQPGGRAQVAQRVAHMVHKTRAGKFDGRDVDRQPHLREQRRVGAGVPGGELSARGLQHPRPQAVDDAGVLGNTDEFRRRDGAERGVVPAQQGLQPEQAPPVGVDLGLVDEAQPAAQRIIHRLAQGGFEREAARDVLVHGRLEEAPLVAARRLGGVHGRVGVAQQGFYRAAVVGEHRHPQAGTDAHLHAVQIDRFVQGAGDLARHGGGAVAPLHPRQQGDEFVAAESPQHVARAQTCLQPRRHGLQQAIPLGVPQAVVDVLEAVHVQEDDAHFLPAAPRRGQHRLGLLGPKAAVDQAGEGVEVRELDQTGVAARQFERALLHQLLDPPALAGGDQQKRRQQRHGQEGRARRQVHARVGRVLAPKAFGGVQAQHPGALGKPQRPLGAGAQMVRRRGALAALRPRQTPVVRAGVAVHQAQRQALQRHGLQPRLGDIPHAKRGRDDAQHLAAAVGRADRVVDDDAALGALLLHQAEGLGGLWASAVDGALGGPSQRLEGQNVQPARGLVGGQRRQPRDHHVLVGVRCRKAAARGVARHDRPAGVAAFVVRTVGARDPPVECEVLRAGVAAQPQLGRALELVLPHGGRARHQLAHGLQRVDLRVQPALQGLRCLLARLLGAQPQLLGLGVGQQPHHAPGQQQRQRERYAHAPAPRLPCRARFAKGHPHQRHDQHRAQGIAQPPTRPLSPGVGGGDDAAGHHRRHRHAGVEQRAQGQHHEQQPQHQARLVEGGWVADPAPDGPGRDRGHGRRTQRRHHDRPVAPVRAEAVVRQDLRRQRAGQDAGPGPPAPNQRGTGGHTGREEHHDGVVRRNAQLQGQPAADQIRQRRDEGTAQPAQSVVRGGGARSRVNDVHDGLSVAAL